MNSNKNNQEQTIQSVPRSKCLLCGGDGELIYEKLPDLQLERIERWNLRRCNNPECSLVWMDPMPLESELHKTYHSYYTYENKDFDTQGVARTTTRTKLVEFLKQAWLLLLGLRREWQDIDILFTRKLKRGRLLEIGCGNARRLARIEKQGWQVEGQDLDETAIQNARRNYQFQLYVGQLAEQKLPPNSYNAIVMNHVIEHVYDPVKLLKECHRLLKPGGALVLATPNPESTGHRWFREKWIGLEQPRHLYLYPTRALQALAERAGFLKSRSWTTTARAGEFFVPSMEIKLYGNHTMGNRMNLKIMIAVLFYQLRARISYLFNKNSGEESLLIVNK